MKPHPLIWFDLETTSLDKANCRVLELAAVYTEDLQPVETFTALIATTRLDLLMGLCDDFVNDMHTTSGLWTDLARAMDEGEAYDSYVTLDADLVAWLDGLGLDPEGPRPLLTGAGVSHFDHQLVERLLPSFAARLHYGDGDTSTVRRTLGSIGHVVIADAMERAINENPHRALTDVHQAIGAAQILRDCIAYDPTVVEGILS